MRAVLQGIAVVLLATMAAPAQADFSNPGGKRCGFVSFEPNSDAGARPTVRGTTCSIARKLVRDYGAKANGRVQPYGVLKLYTCRSRIRQNGHAGNGIAHTDVRCTRGSRKLVTFALS